VITRRLLYLNTHRLSAWLWQRGKLLPEGIFEARDEDIARFADYLSSHRQSQYALLCNVAEEGHTQETIPYLQGGDRKALIGRKLNQHFPGTPLVSAFSLGYEKTKRKNEKLLLSALTNPEHFTPWLQCIARTEVALAGVYTVAQLGGLLLGKLGHKPARCLLLTVQDHSIRESYLVGGQTLFSRMAPLTDSSTAGVAGSLAAEAGKLHQYLLGQRLLGRNETVPAFVLAHPQALTAVNGACINSGNLQFEILDNHRCAEKLGLATPPQDSRNELLFLHLLAIAAPRQQFADEDRRHHYRLAQIRQGLLGLGAISLLGGLLFGGKELYQAHRLQEESQALAIAEADFNWRYQEIAKTFPQLDIDNDTLRRLTSRYAELSQLQRHPGLAYRLLARALDESPAIQLEKLDWKLANGDEILTVRGTIKTLPGTNSRQLLATFEHFSAQLAVDRNTSLKILQQPLDIESGHSLRGGDREDERPLPAGFVVQITRKITP